MNTLAPRMTSLVYIGGPHLPSVRSEAQGRGVMRQVPNYQCVDPVLTAALEFLRCGLRWGRSEPAMRCEVFGKGRMRRERAFTDITNLSLVNAHMQNENSDPRKPSRVVLTPERARVRTASASRYVLYGLVLGIAVLNVVLFLRFGLNRGTGPRPRGGTNDPDAPAAMGTNAAHSSMKKSDR